MANSIITPRILLKYLKTEIQKLRKIKISEDLEEEKRIDLVLKRGKSIAYLANVCSQIIEKHETEKRLDMIEQEIKEMRGQK